VFKIKKVKTTYSQHNMRLRVDAVDLYKFIDVIESHSEDTLFLSERITS